MTLRITTVFRMVAVAAPLAISTSCSPGPAPLPGATGVSPRAGDVVVNELPWQLLDGSEFVEIFNRRDVDVSLDGLDLVDEDDHDLDLVGVLAPKAMLVLEKGVDYQFGWHQGEGATILDADGLVVDRVVGSLEVPRGLSFGRFPDGEGDAVPLPFATPGAPNVAPDPTCPCCGALCATEALCGTAADGSCLPTEDAHCAGSDLCTLHGACSLVTGPPFGVCAPADREDCLESAGCFSAAACSRLDSNGIGVCALTADTDCIESSLCPDLGLCAFHIDRCVRTATVVEGCSAPDGTLDYVPCAAAGDCSLVGGVCVSTELADCLASDVCGGSPNCFIANEGCVAG